MVLKVTQTTPTDPFDHLLGNFGTWQFLIVASILAVKFSSPWVTMSIVFLTPSSTFWCTSRVNDTTFSGVNNTCYDDCAKYEYDVSPMENTIVSEWDLVCGRRWMASFTQTALQMGALVGTALFGFLSDRFGRKISFLLSISLLIVSGFGIPFSSNYATFTILRSLAGASVGGSITVSFVILMEVVGSKYRGIAGSIYHIPQSFAHMSLSVFAYYFRTWDSYTLAMAVPQIIYLGYFFLISESPRWLVSKGRLEQAVIVMKKAAKLNNLPTSNIEGTLQKLSAELASPSSVKKLNYIELFRPSLRLRTISVCCIWVLSGLNYYGVTQFVSQSSSNPFISVASAGAVQLPSGLVVIWLTNQFSRRITIASFFIFESACIIALGTVPNIFWLKVTLGSLGISGSYIVGATLYIQTSELYPTVIRNMAMSTVLTSMKVGSMIAPFVSNSTVAWLPIAIFGLVPLLGASICLYLPETKGKALADSLEGNKNENC